MKIIELKIGGMTCPSCSASVERLVDELGGVESKKINHVSDSGKIEFNEDVISAEEIIAKINEGHYKVMGFEDIENKRDIPTCPICNHSGQLVPNTVFRSNLKPDAFEEINLESKNYICLNPQCDIAYYNDNQTIDSSGLKRVIWFKTSSKKKTICYCNNIDREQIKEAVEIHNLTTWEEITSHYRKKVIEKCEVLNPTGLCCRNTFGKVVSKFNPD